MHILVYFAAVGSVLLGLLFCVDANLAPRGPLAVTTDFQGLPKPWRGPALHFAEAAVSAPDMDSESVQAEAPPNAGHRDSAVTLATSITTASGQAEVTPASKRKKPATRKHVRYDKAKSRYAWQNGDAGSFGFGRF